MSKKFLSPIKLAQGASNPATGSTGELFYNTTDKKIYAHDGISWVSTGGGGSSVVISDTVPAGGTKGDLWLDSTEGTLYIFFEDADSSQWVQVKANSALEGSILARLGALESTQAHQLASATVRVASAAERDSRFPSPVQGNTVFRNDLGVEEKYYAAYNVSTNPGGRTPAGWVPDPIAGLVPISPVSVEKAGTGSTASANSLGLVTFTGVSSINLNNVFSSAYSSYKVLVNITGGTITTSDVQLGLRMPGANTGYETQYVRSYNTNVNAARNPHTTYFWLGPAGFSIYAAYEVTITNPNAAAKTLFTSIGGGDNAASERMTHHVTGYLDNTTQYTGLQMFPVTATVTGTIQVFGYNN